MDAITNAYDSDLRAVPEAASPPRFALGLDPGIKHFRRIATRFEKTAGNFLAAIKLASVRIWL
ncbi:MAG: transposase, partial [Methylobacterium sp.]|nr:transposase [Methylobacterium sp.]